MLRSVPHVLMPSSVLLRPLFALFLLSFALIAVGQSGGFTLIGRLKVDGGDLSGARLVVYRNGVKEKVVTTNLNRFSLELSLQSNYVLSFEKDGFVSKKLQFDTRLPAGVPAKEYAPFEFAVSLFKQYDDMNLVVFDQPVGMIKYEPTLEDFDYDTDYTKSIQARLQQAMAEVEQKQKEEARQASDEAKRQAAAAKEQARQEAEARKQAEATAKAEEARRQAEAKAAAEAEAERAAEIEAQRVAEAKAEQARQQAAAKAAAEAEAKRVADGKAEQARAQAEAKAAADAEARKVAEAKAEQARLDAQRREEERRAAVARSAPPAPAPPPAAPRSASTPNPVPVHTTPRPAPSAPGPTTVAVPHAGEDHRRSTRPVMGEDGPPPPQSLRSDRHGFPEKPLRAPVRHEELVVEPNKVMTVVRLEHEQGATEYRRVVHKWGAVFYFKNGESCTQQVYEREALAGREEDDRLVDAPGGSR